LSFELHGGIQDDINSDQVGCRAAEPGAAAVVSQQPDEILLFGIRRDWL
jgi:hypothetical protein